MEKLSLIILNGNIAVLIVYIFSYAIEKTTGLGLLIWNFRQKKNEFMAKGAATLAAILYFIINGLVLIYELMNKNNNYDDFSFQNWFWIIFILSIIFGIIHFKLTPIDKGRDNYDFSD